MASSGKKKGGKKGNWKSVPVEAVIDANVKKTNWADEVDQVYQDDPSDYMSQKSVVLPTAPRASRASDFDESKIPNIPPFQIHVSNIPYELDDQELFEFFGGLEIKSVRLPKDEGKRAKGYGYVEFETRASLIAALNKPDTMIKNRQIKIELSTADSRGGMNRGGQRGGRDGGMRGGDMGGPDRTTGNWRSGPRDEFEERSGGFERGGGGGGGGGGRGFGGEGRRDFSSGSGGGFRGGFDREDRERGGGFENRDRDRGFQRDDRRDFGDRGFRDDRGDRGGFRENRDRGGGFRDRGFDEERREDRGGGAPAGTGSWRDERPPPRDDRPPRDFGDRGDRGGFERRDDRRRDDREAPTRFERMAARRDEGPPPERGAPVERKKLNLQPRSANPAPESKPAPVASSSIFGGAKPVDTTAREREVEQRLIKGGEDFASEKSGGNRSGPGSTSGGSTKDHQESDRERDATVETAPPPKENPWHRKATSPVVNNGRTTPEDRSGDERGDGQRSWGRDRGEGSRRQEPRRTEEARSSRPPPKTGPPSGTDKGRPREDRPPHKSREPRIIDDVSKMPKVVESKAPVFAAANKFNTLEDEGGPE